jgi:hypothetical protein
MNLNDGKGAKLAIEVIDAIEHNEAALRRRRLPLYKWVFTVVGRLHMC